MYVSEYITNTHTVMPGYQLSLHKHILKTIPLIENESCCLATKNKYTHKPTHTNQTPAQIYATVKRSIQPGVAVYVFFQN